MYHICFVFVYIYPLNSYRKLILFEEPWLTRVATITYFVTEFNATEVGEHISSCSKEFWTLIYHICFVLFTYIRLTATEGSIYSKSFALREWLPLLTLLQSSTPQR